MKTYDKIKEISEKLYVNLKSESDIKERLIDSVDSIQSAILEDFKSLFNIELDLQDYLLYIDDENYRQSATGIVFNETIRNHNDYRIKIECLIHHRKIWVAVKKGQDSSAFKHITDAIERTQNIEGLSELRELKK